LQKDATGDTPHPKYGPIGIWDTSQVTDMSALFYENAEFNADISGWDTSSVKNMSCMFQYAQSFNCDIGAWDTANVTDMSHMFHGASMFNADIGAWDTANVTDMSYIFYEAKSFNQKIDGWETPNVTDTSRMFLNASKIETENFSAWHLPKLQHGSDNMFARDNELLKTITSKEEDKNTSQRNEKMKLALTRLKSRLETLGLNMEQKQKTLERVNEKIRLISNATTTNA
jgi:surface protein